MKKGHIVGRGHPARRRLYVVVAGAVNGHRGQSAGPLVGRIPTPARLR